MICGRFGPCFGWIAPAQGDENGFDDLPANGFKRTRPQPGNKMPGIVFQKLYPKFFVTGQKQPVLGQDHADGSLCRTQLQAPVQEYRGQIIFTFLIMLCTECLEGIVLLAPGQIGYIGDDPVVFLC